MLEFLGKCFEKACSVLAWINQFLWLILGIIFGVVLKNELFIDGFLGVLIVIGVALFGFLLAFVMNIFVFGYISQIIQIRKSLEK